VAYQVSIGARLIIELESEARGPLLENEGGEVLWGDDVSAREDGESPLELCTGRWETAQ